MQIRTHLKAHCRHGRHAERWQILLQLCNLWWRLLTQNAHPSTNRARIEACIEQRPPRLPLPEAVQFAHVSQRPGLPLLIAFARQSPHAEPSEEAQAHPRLSAIVEAIGAMVVSPAEARATDAHLQGPGQGVRGRLLCDSSLLQGILDLAASLLRQQLATQHCL